MGSGPWNAGPVVWPVLFLPMLLMLAVLVIGLVFLLSWLGPARTERRRRSPEEALRDRYARGEINRQRYREALADVLKDRYVRGEIGLDAYESRLGQLLQDERPLPNGSGDEQTAAMRRDVDGGTKGDRHTREGPSEPTALR